MEKLTKVRNKVDYECGKILQTKDEQDRAFRNMNKKAKITIFVLAAIYTTICMTSLFVFATETSSGDGKNVLAQLISILLSIFRYVGIALVAWGAIQFILATKRTDAESKSDAITTAICGIALTLLPTLLGAIMSEFGVTGISDKLLGQ